MSSNAEERGKMNYRSTTVGGRRLAIAATALCGLACVLGMIPGTAMANRALDSKMTGLNGVFSVTPDASGNVWVSDGGQSNANPPGPSGLYKYDPFPSQTLLTVPQTFDVWSVGEYLWLDLAVDDQTGQLFVGQTNSREVDIFDPATPGSPCDENAPICFSHSWTRINGALTCFTCTPEIKLAIDNTATPSRGRVYLSLTAPENDVEVFDNAQRPVDFPAQASYISDNKLTGTPSGPFGEVGYVTVDDKANIYVTDWGKKEIDEFDSSGTFLRSFPAPRAQIGLPGTASTTIDPTNGNVLIAEQGFDEETGEGGVREYDESGNFLGVVHPTPATGFQPEGRPMVNAAGYLYAPSGTNVFIFKPAPIVPKVEYAPVSSPTTTSGTLNATIDPNGGGAVTECKFEYGTSTSYGTAIPCVPPGGFSTTADVSAPLVGLATGTEYHYRVVVHNANGVKYGADQVYVPHGVLGLTTDPATNVGEVEAALNGDFAGNGESTSYHFEWGRTTAYGNSSAPEAMSPSIGSAQALTAHLEDLAPYSTYHFRVIASNSSGVSVGQDQMFTTTPGKPQPTADSVTNVHADRVVFHGQVNPEGAETSVHFEYVPDSEYQRSGYAGATKTGPETEIGMSKHPQPATAAVTGLEPGTVYHYRVVGENSAGSGPFVDHTFSTFPFQREVDDKCPNAHVRQQTGSALLLDCRAYELVSAANAGGYDVESTLVQGQEPFGSYPEAQTPGGQPRVLYGIHDGGIPGIGNATNRGVDPYVATRGAHGWTTTYVGIPADEPPSPSPFSSSLAEADPRLDTFAFGGPELCSPCFEDGSTGVPVHTPDGQLVQGMQGSIANPSAEPAGFVGRHLSGDGTHLIFGSATRLANDAEEGKISIYDRNLAAHTTSVVSKLPGGGNIPCTINCASDGIGELDVSKDGSRVVVGELLAEEGGARYWHLYMDIGDSTKSVDLTPGALNGAMFAGMSADGSRVYFTTTDRLLPSEDTDHSADLYEAEVNSQGQVTLHLVSVGGGSGNSDSCQPFANTKHEHWNTTGSEENCGVVAVGGGGGVASGGGVVFFLSPELLAGAGEGVQNAPNLYSYHPGSSPEFVATLESSANAPIPPEQHSLVRAFGSFANPTATAIDHATGDIYVLDPGVSIGQGFVYKFTPEGKPILSFGQNGKLTISGTLGFNNWPTEIAVDNDPTSSSYGDFYVPELDDEHSHYFIQKFSPSGEHIAKIETYRPVGVSVNPSNGKIYVISFAGYLIIYNQNGTLSSFTPIGEHSPEPEGVAVDFAGNAYVVNGGGPASSKGTTEMYDPSGNWVKQIDKRPSYGVAFDVATEKLYVDEGTQVTEFDAGGNAVGAPTGTGVLSGSVSLSADSDTLAVSNPGSTNVATFGPLGLPPDPETDNPLVIDSVSAPSTRHTADFELTPSGDDAVFTSTMPLTGYDNGQVHREIFRLDSQRGLECASCNPTAEQASGEASLPVNGLGLSDDGRVFFNSTEGLVDRDLNEREDAYQWEPKGYEFGNGAPACETSGGCVDLISPGSSPFAASLLGISEQGTDAYFFTHDKLAEEDRNGTTVKIYDARSLGGFNFVFPEPQCKASDECHGAGTPQPPPPLIKSVAPSPGGNASSECKKNFVRKKGQCVRKPHKPKHRRHHHRKAHRHD